MNESNTTPPKAPSWSDASDRSGSSAEESPSRENNTLDLLTWAVTIVLKQLDDLYKLQNDLLNEQFHISEQLEKNHERLSEANDNLSKKLNSLQILTSEEYPLQDKLERATQIAQLEKIKSEL